MTLSFKHPRQITVMIGSPGGLAAARSPEVIHSPLMETLVWLRVPGDIVFAIGGVFLGVYAFHLLRRGGSKAEAKEPAPAVQAS